MTPAAAEFDTALRQTRVRLHRSVLPTSLAGSAGMALVLALLLWDHVPAARLLGWMALLGAVLLARAAMGQAQRRDAAALDRAALWLRRHRIAFLMHGLVWAAAGVLLMPAEGGEAFKLMVVAFAALVAGSMIAAAFDMPAAALFATPPVAVLAATLGLRAEPGSGTLAAMLLVFLLITGLSARRTQQGMVDGVHRQLADAQRARQALEAAAQAEQAHRQLADQHHLLTQLMQTTHQGFWFLDNAGVTTQVNPAMALMLGRTRESILGKSVFDFFSGAELDLLRLEFENRRQGRPGGYEITLTRPDGTRLQCVNHATPIYDTAGARVGSVGLFTDITVRREAEGTLSTYELVVNSITDWVSVTDANEIYRLVNDAWCRATGVPREQALGRPSTEAYPGGVLPERRQALQSALATGRPHSARAHVAGPGSESRVLETTYYPYTAGAAQARFVAIVTRDITQQEQALRRLQALQADQNALLEAFPGFIGRLDAEANYTYGNQRLARILGTTPQGMVNRPSAELLGEVRAREMKALIARVLAGETVVYEGLRPAHDGIPEAYSEITLAAGVDPRTGAPTVFGFGIDISARKRAEDALIAARDEAQSANRAKSQFLAQMSHELRTPLNAILGFGQLLESDPRQPLPPRQQAHVLEILRGARHLLALINEILDLGRIETGSLALQPQAVPLAPLVDECLGLMRALALGRGVQLLPPVHEAPALAAHADATRLKQVLLNLLGNAIKYNRVGGQVQLSCSGNSQRVRLAVRDTGRGLAPAEMARLFQPFERLGAAASGIEGTGIGLALSRRLMEAMGGEIGVESRPGEGSLFWLSLPQAAPEAPGMAAAPHADSTASCETALTAPHTVLYIEDNAVNVVLMEAMLARAAGLRVLSALLPETGIEVALRERPALILLDIQLPGIDGFEVLLRLRGQAATRHIPVVAVSANAVASDVEAALAAGFNAYLTKPLELNTLLATVQRLLGTEVPADNAR